VKVAHHEESALADDEMVGYASKTNSPSRLQPATLFREGVRPSALNLGKR
jgi:phage head maturation protease